MSIYFHCLLGLTHDDVINWKHFPRFWPFVRGIHRSPVNSPHKGQWRRAFVWSLISPWINGLVNNGEAGDLRRHCVHYDVTVMGVMYHFSSTRDKSGSQSVVTIQRRDRYLWATVLEHALTMASTRDITLGFIVLISGKHFRFPFVILRAIQDGNHLEATFQMHFIEWKVFFSLKFQWDMIPSIQLTTRHRW